MIHITLTGYYAGNTVCGAPRNIEGDRYAHVGAWLDNPNVADAACPECLAVYNDVGGDDDDE